MSAESSSGQTGQSGQSGQQFPETSLSTPAREGVTENPVQAVQSVQTSRARASVRPSEELRASAAVGAKFAAILEELAAAVEHGRILIDPRAGGPRQVTRLRVSSQVFTKSATLQREEAERLERRAAERAQWESPDWMLEKLKLKAKGR